MTAAGAIGTASQAEAALYYWSDSDSGYSRPGPAAPQRRQKPRRQQAKKIELPEKESAKPQGPLVISISIDHQNVKVYDDRGFFAEGPVSTGMKGHPTPMGVFSVIEKQKMHHSNIYSGAPMPFMQRITWSGVAMHAGVLPGYPASHGCIRMPAAFAVKMYGWTRLGARVLITPGELSPESFSHPLLVAQKVVPQPTPVAEPQADAPVAPKSDKASDAGTTDKPAISEARLELRSTVGHLERSRQAMDQATTPTSLREQTHTADASGDMPTSRPPATMTDAAGGNAPPHQEPATRADDMPPAAAVDAASAKAGEASTPAETLKSEETKSEVAKSEAERAAAKPVETAAPDEKSAESKSSEAAAAEVKPAEAGAADPTADKPDQAVVAAQPAGDAAKTDDVKADDVKVDAAKADTPAVSEMPDPKPEAVRPVASSSPAAPEAKKDDARLPPEIAKPAAAKPEKTISAAPKRAGQIAVFISRKDGKLYVRQNFAPLFDAPVTIAPSDRPLGTHVFTAEIDKNDSNVVHWSVVSLPVPRHAARRDEDERVSSRRGKHPSTAVVETKPVPAPDSPAEALDRITIPADVMARITDALTTGASIVVSDQGINQGETGEGTDFIVSLR
ncbi:MAG TPA: L,D-transpeptidase family protein [Bradyrhizobium sp.]|nr:L,D-transpeptidase family protein [Bradyrhizobium sp.]HTB03790.1 L,D-transpeptidase family protein [Bradyrhizobium sp.]